MTTPNDTPESNDVKPEEMVRVLTHVSTELEVLASHQNLDRATAAEQVRRKVNDWLLEARRAAAEAAA